MVARVITVEDMVAGGGVVKNGGHVGDIGDGNDDIRDFIFIKNSNFVL